MEFLGHFNFYPAFKKSVKWLSLLITPLSSFKLTRFHQLLNTPLKGRLILSAGHFWTKMSRNVRSRHRNRDKSWEFMFCPPSQFLRGWSEVYLCVLSELRFAKERRIVNKVRHCFVSGKGWHHWALGGPFTYKQGNCSDSRSWHKRSWCLMC